MTIETERIRDAAEALDTLTSQLPAGHQLRADADARAKSCVAALYSAADHIDAQAAEIARLRDGIEEAIRLLGMDRPIDPTDTLRAALSGECHD